MKEKFLLDPSLTFLNFGSFGACPKPVFETYQQTQLDFERNPIHFMTIEGPARIQKNKEALAEFLHCDPIDLVFVTNPSYAVNLVAKYIKLSPGDEVLATSIEYGACDKTWSYYCEKQGARYVRQAITLPLVSESQFMEEFFQGVHERTKLIFISHITSSTALIFPVKKIVERAKQLGIETFIDGAHAPAHIGLNLTELDCDYYTGACHKWMMTPKGSSFLFAKKSVQQHLDPLIVSWGYKALFPGLSQFQDYHQMNGTRDISAFCCILSALDFMREHQWHEVAAQCRQLVYANAERFAQLLGSPVLAPLHESFIGQMLSLQIETQEPEKLKQHLFEHFRIEIPVMRQDDKNYIRFSIQAFNSQNDLDTLYKALEEEIRSEKWLKKMQ